MPTREEQAKNNKARRGGVPIPSFSLPSFCAENTTSETTRVEEIGGQGSEKGGKNHASNNYVVDRENKTELRDQHARSQRQQEEQCVGEQEKTKIVGGNSEYSPSASSLASVGSGNKRRRTSSGKYSDDSQGISTNNNTNQVERSKKIVSQLTPEEEDLEAATTESTNMNASNSATSTTSKPLCEKQSHVSSVIPTSTTPPPTTTTESYDNGRDYINTWVEGNGIIPRDGNHDQQTSISEPTLNNDTTTTLNTVLQLEAAFHLFLLRRDGIGVGVGNSKKEEENDGNNNATNNDNSKSNKNKRHLITISEFRSMFKRLGGGGSSSSSSSLLLRNGNKVAGSNTPVTSCMSSSSSSSAMNTNAEKFLVVENDDNRQSIITSSKYHNQLEDEDKILYDLIYIGSPELYQLIEATQSDLSGTRFSTAIYTDANDNNYNRKILCIEIVNNDNEKEQNVVGKLSRMDILRKLYHDRCSHAYRMKKTDKGRLIMNMITRHQRMKKRVYSLSLAKSLPVTNDTRKGPQSTSNNTVDTKQKSVVVTSSMGTLATPGATTKTTTTTTSSCNKKSIKESYIHPNMTLEQRVQARAKHRQTSLSSCKPFTPSLNVENGATTPATAITTTTDKSILLRFADAIRLHVRHKTNRTLFFAGSTAMVGGIGTSSNNATGRGHIKSKTTLSFREIWTCLSGSMRRGGGIGAHGSRGMGKMSRDGMPFGSLGDGRANEDRASKKMVACALLDLEGVVPDWITIVDENKKKKNSVQSQPEKKNEEEEKDAEGSNNIGLSKNAIVIIRNDADYNAVRVKLGGRDPNTFSNARSKMHNHQVGTTNSSAPSATIRPTLTNPILAASMPPPPAKVVSEVNLAKQIIVSSNVDKDSKKKKKKSEGHDRATLSTTSKALATPHIPQSRDGSIVRIVSLTPDDPRTGEIIPQQPLPLMTTTQIRDYCANEDNNVVVGPPVSKKARITPPASGVDSPSSSRSNVDDTSAACVLPPQQQVPKHESCLSVDQPGPHHDGGYRPSKLTADDEEDTVRHGNTTKHQNSPIVGPDRSHPIGNHNKKKKSTKTIKKKKEPLRLNHFLIFSDADINGGEVIKPTMDDSPRGLKRLFSQMNSGKRI